MEVYCHRLAHRPCNRGRPYRRGRGSRRRSRGHREIGTRAAARVTGGHIAASARGHSASKRRRRVVVRVLLNNAITPVSEVERTVQYVQKYAADNGLTEAVPKAAPKRRPPQGEARDGGCVRRRLPRWWWWLARCWLGSHRSETLHGSPQSVSRRTCATLPGRSKTRICSRACVCRYVLFPHHVGSERADEQWPVRRR